MDEKELLRQYQDQMTSRLQNEPNQPDPNSGWGNTVNSSNSSVSPASNPDVNQSPLDKIKSILTDKKNRLYVIIGGFVFFLVFLALLAPIIAPLLKSKPPQATPEPTYTPTVDIDQPRTFYFDSEINSDFVKLESDLKQVEIVDLEMSFPQTEWEVEF